jgi:heptosyltransferase-2
MSLLWSRVCVNGLFCYTELAYLMVTQRKILIVGPAWVGDMIMAQCLFKLLKQHEPSAQIDVLAPAWTFAPLSRMLEVSKAIDMPLTHGDIKFRARYQLAKQLRAEQYNQAIVLPNSFKSALIPWFAHIPKRTGWVGEHRYIILNDARRLNKKRYPLMIEQFMALALPADTLLPVPYPSPELIVSVGSQQVAMDKYRLRCHGQPVLALCVGAAFGPAKRWPAKYFAQIAKCKLAEGWEVWLFGSQKDNFIAEEIMQLTDDRCRNVVGCLELTETIDLLSLVTGVVTNDSGLMHVAAALKKPLIAIYGSTSPALTPPLSAEATIMTLNLDCQPCFARTCPLQHHRCMHDLMPDRVLAAIAMW